MRQFSDELTPPGVKMAWSCSGVTARHIDRHNGGIPHMRTKPGWSQVVEVAAHAAVTTGTRTVGSEA